MKPSATIRLENALTDEPSRDTSLLVVLSATAGRNPAIKLADRNYQLLLSDLRHPSLHFKKIGKLWSVRVGLHYRALAVEDGNDVVWFWIGSHAEYDQLIYQ